MRSGQEQGVDRNEESKAGSVVGIRQNRLKVRMLGFASQSLDV